MSENFKKQDLEVIAGNTFNLDLEVLVVDDLGNEVPDPALVGATGIMQLRRSVTDEELLAEDATPLITAGVGLVQYTLSKEVTATLIPEGRPAASYVYGCVLRYSDGTVQTIIAGKLKVIKGVVR